MRSGEVLVSDLTSRGKKVFHKGDTCFDYNFHNGSFDKMIEGGFIKETTMITVEGDPDAEPGEKLTKGELPEGSPLKEGADVDFKDLDKSDKKNSKKR